MLFEYVIILHFEGDFEENCPDMIRFLIISLFGGLCVLLFFILRTRWKFRSLNKLPGPKSLPFIGHAYLLSKDHAKNFQTAFAVQDKYGPITPIWIGPFNCHVLTSDLELIELILSSPKTLDKSMQYNYFAPWLGEGIFTCRNVQQWHRRRKLLTPAFHFKILEDYISVFHNQADALIKNLDKYVVKDVCDVYPHITAYTMDAICETAMGVEMNSQDMNFRKANEYGQAVHDIVKVVLARMYSAFLRFDIFYYFSSTYQLQRKCLSIIQAFDRSLITKRKKKLLENENNSQEEYDDVGIKKKKAFLDILLETRVNGEPLPDTHIKEEVHTFMFGGHDTLASAISFALFALANNPQVQEKLVAELKCIFGDKKNSIPTMSELQQMKYTELVIKESLRVYTPVSMVGRYLVEDLQYKDLLLPKGIEVILFMAYVHKDPKIYPEPEQFDPERFLQTEKRNPFTFLPFSAGPRNCIGQKFAMVELKVALAKILRNFELSSAGPDYDVILSMGAVLKSDVGMNVKLKHRNF